MTAAQQLSLSWDALHTPTAPSEHKSALASPAPGFERALVAIVKALAEYADAHRQRYGGTIKSDYIIGECWYALGSSVIGLLDGETGRLDCGTLDGFIRDLIDSDAGPEATRTVMAATTPEPPPRAARGQRQKSGPVAAEPAKPIGTRTLNERQRELVGMVRVEDNVAVYTDSAHIPDWSELKSTMLALGGKWRSKKGFVFPDDIDAAERVRLAVATGEILDPKAADLFETPADLADELASYIDPKPGDVILEPSAGRGALVLATLRRCPEARFVCIEPFADNLAELSRIGIWPLAMDFADVTATDVGEINHAILNPPFSRRKDSSHILHALSLLPVGGRLAAIASSGVLHRDDSTGRAFRAEVHRHGGTIECNPDGSFAKAGTMVRTATVKLTKRSI